MSENENLPSTVQLSTTPQVATDQARSTAVFLKKLLDQKPRPVMINGKRHMEFDDWITLGNYYGITVETGEAEQVEVFGVPGFRAKARVLRIDTGTVIGGAEAYCLSNERNWKDKPMFQLASMAQTRSGSKALANVLRWVVALEGISGTPAEEMDNVAGNRKRPSKSMKQSPRKPAPPQNPREPKGTVEGEVTKKKPKPATNKEKLEKNGAKVEPVIDWDTERKQKPYVDLILTELEEKSIKITNQEILRTSDKLYQGDTITKDEFKQIKELLGVGK